MPDLLLWDEALRGDQILDAETKERMYTPYVPIDFEGESFYGYGWFVQPLEDGTTLISHGGTNTIFVADLIRFVDSDTTIVLATNNSVLGVLDLGGVVIDALFGGGGGVCEVEPPSVADTAAFELLTDYPETPEGDAMAEWISILLSGSPIDPASLLGYVERSVGQGFLNELGAETLVGLVESLQADLDGLAVDRIYQEDDTTFHVVVVDAQDNETLLSARIGTAPDSRVECVGLPE